MLEEVINMIAFISLKKKKDIVLVVKKKKKGKETERTETKVVPKKEYYKT